MNQKTISANGNTLLVIEVPENAIKYEIEKTSNGISSLFFRQKYMGFENIGALKFLGKEKYSILGIVENGVPDFACHNLVEKGITEISMTSPDGMGYKKYIDSFLSLLSSNGIEVSNKKYCVLKIESPENKQP